MTKLQVTPLWGRRKVGIWCLVDDDFVLVQPDINAVHPVKLLDNIIQWQMSFRYKMEAKLRGLRILKDYRLAVPASYLRHDVVHRLVVEIEEAFPALDIRIRVYLTDAD